MVRKLEAAGIVLTAAGLAVMAYVDPLVRIILFGAATSSQTAIAARSSFLNCTAAAASFAGRGAIVGTNATLLIGTLSAFCAAVVGLVLIVTSLLTRQEESQPAPKNHSQ